MPFIFRFDHAMVKIEESKKADFDKLIKQYDGKVFQNREELVKARNELSEGLKAITGKGLIKSKCKFGSHSALAISGILTQLKNAAPTQAERDKWQARQNKLLEAYGKAEEKIAKLYENEPEAIAYNILPDPIGNPKTSFFTEEIEAELEAVFKELNAEVKEELRSFPVSGTDYNNDSFRRDAMEIFVHYTESALNDSLENELSKTDNYLVGNNLIGLIPQTNVYGKAKGEGNVPHINDYVRFEHLVPLHAPVVKAMRLVEGNIAYEKKGKKTTKEDELQVREQILAEGADALYAMDKIKKNIVNEEVKAEFPAETAGAYTDSAGSRGQLNKWEGMLRSRRMLILNGWDMGAVTAIGRIAAIAGPIAEKNIQENKALWDKYREEQTTYESRLKADEEARKRGENPIRVFAPAKPSKEEYTEAEINAIRSLKEKIDNCVNTPLNSEEHRREQLNSIIADIEKLPEKTKERFSPLKGIIVDLKRAAEHQLTKAEKEILSDPSVLRDFADMHPVKQYTEAEQQKDLEWLRAQKQKDKELNDIFKKDPYAHDKIRTLQENYKNDPEIIALAVRNAIGKEAWNAFKPIEGRKGDVEKALDILTHPSSPHNVIGKHELLDNIENSLRLKTIDVKKSNCSNIGFHEMTAVFMNLMNFIPAIAPGTDPAEFLNDAIARENDGDIFNRQNEYIERLNKVLENPGDLSELQQRQEIGRCIMGLLAPISTEVNRFELNDEIFNKENLSPEEKKELGQSYTRLFDLKGGLVNSECAEKIKPVFALVDKALDRVEDLMVNMNHEASIINIRPLQVVLKNAVRGTSMMKILSMDPVIKTVDANLRSPMELEIDREKKPIIPGKTGDFTFAEIEEKKDIFPVHKAVNAEQELKNIWGEYLKERENGPLSREKEQEYWQRIDNCYTTIETIVNDLTAKQEASKQNNPGGPTFADENMRNMLGGTEANKSFDDVISGSRGMKPSLRYVSGRREAVGKGWTLNELGLYSHLQGMVFGADANLEKVEALGDETKEFVKRTRELKEYLNEHVLGKEYVSDPEKRAELYGEIAGRVQWLREESKRLRGLPGMTQSQADSISHAIGDTDNVNGRSDDGGMPLDYEVRLMQKEAELEAVEKAKKELDALKDTADPIVYNQLKSLVNKNAVPPKQDQMTIDAGFVEKTDIYLKTGIGSLKKEIEAIKNGKETTLMAKTGLSHEASVDRIRRMLDNTDSIFHFDSAKYKEIKAGLKKLGDGNAAPEDKQKLTEDVKAWFNDPKYDRKNRHANNEFDNMRFNIMFTLANELDPAWAKDNFKDMNISVLHGEKAANTSFHNIHEYMDFMHVQMADNQYLYGAEDFTSKHWYKRAQDTSYGQKGLVEEAIRVMEDKSIADIDKMKAELDNINKLTGDALNMEKDLGFKARFSVFNSYRQNMEQLISGSDYFMEDYDRRKNSLKAVREQAVDQIKEYLNKPENRNDRLFDKAVLAYGVMDPRGAHNMIIELNERKTGNKKVKPVSLPELEKRQGLDIGGRKTLDRNRAVNVKERKNVL